MCFTAQRPRLALKRTCKASVAFQERKKTTATPGRCPALFSLWETSCVYGSTASFFSFQLADVVLDYFRHAWFALKVFPQQLILTPSCIRQITDGQREHQNFFACLRSLGACRVATCAGHSSRGAGNRDSLPVSTFEISQRGIV